MGSWFRIGQIHQSKSKSKISQRLNNTKTAQDASLHGPEFRRRNLPGNPARLKLKQLTCRVNSVRYRNALFAQVLKGALELRVAPVQQVVEGVADFDVRLHAGELEVVALKIEDAPGRQSVT